jgi:predicted transcriptional regulator of viral defense system
MRYLSFRQKMFPLVCFSTHQVLALEPDFDGNNLTRWVQQGWLIRLRQGWYTFPEYSSHPDYSLWFANRIYAPSYISLHTALSFYGMIPEAVVRINSVTSLKTASFRNPAGEYTYQTIRENLMFGYDLKPMADGHHLRMASPEKALLDLLYLYPEYNTPEAMEGLRLDEDFLAHELNKELFREVLKRMDTQALAKRVQLLSHIYPL